MTQETVTYIHAGHIFNALGFTGEDIDEFCENVLLHFNFAGPALSLITSTEFLSFLNTVNDEDYTSRFLELVPQRDVFVNLAFYNDDGEEYVKLPQSLAHTVDIW